MIKWEREAKTPKGFEGVVKELKKNPEVSNPWAIAWSMKNKGIKPKSNENNAMYKPISEGDMTGLTSMSAKGEGEAEFEVEKEKEGVEIEIGMTVATTKEAVTQLKEIAKQIEEGYTQGAFVDGEWDLSKEALGEIEPEPAAKPEKKEKPEEPIQEEGSY